MLSKVTIMAASAITVSLESLIPANIGKIIAATPDISPNTMAMAMPLINLINTASDTSLKPLSILKIHLLTCVTKAMPIN